MSKKLLSLVFVLALAGIASAAVQWDGAAFTDATAGNWNVATNWTTDTLPISTTDTVRWDQTVGATGSNIIVDSAVSGGIKMQSKNGNTKLLITSTGSISNDGSVEMGTGTGGDATVTIEGVFNACQRLTQSLGTFKLGTAAASGKLNVVDVYGTLNVKNTGTMTTNNSDIAVGVGTGTGLGRLNIYDGGLVDVDAYSVNTALVASGPYQGQMRGKIQFEDMGGIMRIKGNVLATVTADITAGKIRGWLAVPENTLHGPIYATLTPWLNVVGGRTYTLVPEPATIALLGLGSLTLLRRKR